MPVDQNGHNSTSCPNCGTLITARELFADEFETIVKEEMAAKEELLKRAIKAKADTEARELRDRLQIAEKNELELRKTTAELLSKQRQFDLEIERKKAEIQALADQSVREQIQRNNEIAQLKLREMTMMNEALVKDLDAMRARAEGGSQQRKGEALEVEMEDVLTTSFPNDQITAIPVGQEGADILQVISTSTGEVAGSILWEMKRRSQWRQSYVDRLKENQRAENADIAVIVSTVLPAEISHIGQIDGVWVCSMSAAEPLAMILRQNAIQLHSARMASRVTDNGLQTLREYVTGVVFKQRVEAMIKSYNDMTEHLAKDRKQAEVSWNERKKQITKIASETSGIIGDLHGITGSVLVEFESPLLLESSQEAPTKGKKRSGGV